jgi:hypothetical protein
MPLSAGMRLGPYEIVAAPGIPHPLFKLSAPHGGRNGYVVAHDGKRFLVSVPEQQQTPPS